MEIFWILEKGATFPSRVITRLEKTETRGTVLDCWVVWEPTGITSDTDLNRSHRKRSSHVDIMN